MQNDEQVDEKDYVPSYDMNDKKYDIVYQRGKDLYNIDRDEVIWYYLFDIWLNPNSGCLGISLQINKSRQYHNVGLRTMVNRLFRDYYLNSKDHTSL